jgi:hypothetical protein
VASTVTDVRLLHRTELIAEHLVFLEVQGCHTTPGVSPCSAKDNSASRRAVGSSAAMIAGTSRRRLGLSLPPRLGRLCIHVILRAMSTYVVTQDGPYLR